MKNAALKKILNHSYEFRESKDDLKTVRAVHDGTFQGGESGNPDFHCYAAVLNTVGEFATQALHASQLSKFNNLLADAQDEYTPGYPPMSPVTTSLFHTWMTLDATISSDGPSLGELFAQWLRAKDAYPYLWKALDILNKTCCSFYEVVGVREEENIQLRDVLQQREFPCWNSSGYPGKTGEVWYVRVVPPYMEETACSVTVSTPYVFRNENRKSIEAFFRRRLSENSTFDVLDYLKHGTFPHYWLEYVFQAYASHTGNAIFLEGLPDDPASRPHSNGGRDL